MAPSGAPFAHLHVHTEYSMLDGAARLKDLFAEVKSQGMTHVAMTDHGNMFAAAEFHRQARGGRRHAGNRDRGLRRAGIQEQHQPDPVGPAAPEEGRRLRRPGPTCTRPSGRRNSDGLHNLFKLSSRSYAEGMAGQVAADG